MNNSVTPAEMPPLNFGSFHVNLSSVALSSILPDIQQKVQTYVPVNSSGALSCLVIAHGQTGSSHQVLNRAAHQDDQIVFYPCPILERLKLCLVKCPDLLFRHAQIAR